MRRTVFNEDHEAFRETIRDFIANEVVPVYPEWEQAGYPPRDFYLRLGELGIFGIEVPEEHGGAGVTGVFPSEPDRVADSDSNSGTHTIANSNTDSFNNAGFPTDED